MSAVPAQTQLSLPGVMSAKEVGLPTGREAKAMTDVDNDAGSGLGVARPCVIAEPERLSAKPEVDRIVARHVLDRIEPGIGLDRDRAAADQTAESGPGAALQTCKFVEIH